MDAHTGASAWRDALDHRTVELLERLLEQLHMGITSVESTSTDGEIGRVLSTLPPRVVRGGVVGADEARRLGEPAGTGRRPVSRELAETLARNRQQETGAD